MFQTIENHEGNGWVEVVVTAGRLPQIGLSSEEYLTRVRGADHPKPFPSD
jgi:hypothetical protein